MAVFVVLGDAHRHHADRLDPRPLRRQVGYGAVEMRAIVQFWSDDDLCVYFDALLSQPMQLIHHVGRVRIAQDLASKLQRRGVN